MSLEDGIDFHLKFENDYSDSAGNISDGTPNGAGFVADDPVGVYSTILDGLNDRIIWSNEAELNPGLNDFTYGAIFKKDGITGADQHFFDKGFGSGGRIRFYMTNTGVLILKMGAFTYSTALSLTDTSNFHLVQVSVDRDSISNSFFQIDSSFVTFNVAGSSGVDLISTQDMAIGARSDGAVNYLKGRISQFTKWNRFLSQSEGLEYYNSGAFKDLLPPIIAAGRRRRMLTGRN